MAVILFRENGGYSPLERDIYRTLNDKLADRGDEIDGSVIRLVIDNHRNGLSNGFVIDRLYCDDLILKFMFSQISDREGSNKDVLIHHVIEYDFNRSFSELQMEMAENLKACSEYFYLPEVRHLEMSYCMKSRNSLQLIFDLVTEKSKLKMVCCLLLSHDIALFARGW